MKHLYLLLCFLTLTSCFQDRVIKIPKIDRAALGKSGGTSEQPGTGASGNHHLADSGGGGQSGGQSSGEGGTGGINDEDCPNGNIYSATRGCHCPIEDTHELLNGVCRKKENNTNCDAAKFLVANPNAPTTCMCQDGYAMTSGSCSQCTNGKVSNDNRTECICPGGTVLVNDSCVNSNCEAENTHFDTDSGNCVCNTGYAGNPKSGGCYQNCAKDGYVVVADPADAEASKCQCNGDIQNAADGSTFCTPKCANPALVQLGLNDDSCVCPAGKFGDPKATNFSGCNDCTTHFVSDSPERLTCGGCDSTKYTKYTVFGVGGLTTDLCVNKCPANSYNNGFDPTTFDTCVSYDANTMSIISNDNNIHGLVVCKPNYAGSPANGCIPCTGGLSVSSDRKSCVCNRVLNSGGKCEDCPAGTQADNEQSHSCQPLPGYAWVNSDHTATGPGAQQCMASQNLIPNTSQSACICKEGYIKNPQTQNCDFCPANRQFVTSEGTTICLPCGPAGTQLFWNITMQRCEGCPNLQIPDDTQAKCVCSTTKLDPAFGNTCCAAGKVAIAAGLCCNPGETNASGHCCPAAKPTWSVQCNQCFDTSTQKCVNGVMCDSQWYTSSCGGRCYDTRSAACSSNRLCPTSHPSFTNGICCPNGKIGSGSQCCTSSKTANADGKTFACLDEGQTIFNMGSDMYGRRPFVWCCPNGQHCATSWEYYPHCIKDGVMQHDRCREVSECSGSASPL